MTISEGAPQGLTNSEMEMVTPGTPPKAAQPAAHAERDVGKKVRELVTKWKVERDAKCANCAKGLDLGAHGCHFEEDGDESFAVGNCKAWPLSNQIKQLEAALLAEGGKG